jgi:phospholipid/cholesterol/gamma-HCH transport system substrate-binding protein
VSRSLSYLQAVLIGLVVLVGLGLGGFGLFLVGNRQWFPGDSFHIRSGFKSIQGVEVGTRVRVQGIDAGEVVGIESPTTPGDNVVLRLRIDGKMRSLLRANAIVQIVSEGLVGGKAIEIEPGSADAPPVQDGALVASRPTTEITQAVAELKETLTKEIGPTMEQARRSMEQIGNAAQSFEKTSDTFRKLPIIRGYSRDAQAILNKPGHERVRINFAESDLFDPGDSTLKASGKQRLDGITDKLKGSLMHDGAELVVVALTDPHANPKAAQTLTEAQSSAVASYLKDHHAIQKANLFSWRSVTALGLGTDPYPGDADPKAPAPPRIEVIVFVPRK